MAALAGHLREAEPSGLASLPSDLQHAILRSVSEISEGFSHALVCREWADLALSAQASCACTLKATRTHMREVAAGGVTASQLSQELSLLPNLTSVDISATDPEDTPQSVFSSLPDTLRHLWVRDKGVYRVQNWPMEPVLQNLSRLQSLETLSMSHLVIPTDAFPLSASLRHLDLGGNRKMIPYSYRSPHFVTVGERNTSGPEYITESFLEHISELRELRTFRARLCEEVRALPESMSRLSNLLELNISARDLTSLFSGIGQCRKLRRLLISTYQQLALPPSLTRLSQLSSIYLSAGGIHAPPGMDALLSVRTIEVCPCDVEVRGVFEVDALFSVPSLHRVQTARLPTEMTMQTSLQELVLYACPQGIPFPESLWALRSLRMLLLQDLELRAVPDAIRGLSSLEELSVIHCRNIQALPDSLTELPILKKVVLAFNPQLRSFPTSMGSWPSLRSLRLAHLARLQIPEDLLSKLLQLEDFTVMDVELVNFSRW